MFNFQFTRTRAIVLCISTLATTAVFVVSGFLFVMLAVGGSTYDSVTLEFKYINQACSCRGSTAFRGRAYIRIDYKMDVSCTESCRDSPYNGQTKGWIHYTKDGGRVLWEAQIKYFPDNIGFGQRGYLSQYCKYPQLDLIKGHRFLNKKNSTNFFVIKDNDIDELEETDVAKFKLLPPTEFMAKIWTECISYLENRVRNLNRLELEKKSKLLTQQECMEILEIDDEGDEKLDVVKEVQEVKSEK